MWLVDLSNPNKMEQTWDCIFFNVWTYVKTFQAKKIFFIIVIVQKRPFCAWIGTWTGLDRPWYTFWQKVLNGFHNAQKEALWQKKFLKSVHRGKSAKMAKKPLYCQIAILALLPLCTNFKNFFCQRASFWALWKSFSTFCQKVYHGPSKPVHVPIQAQNGRFWTMTMMKKIFFAWNVFT